MSVLKFVSVEVEVHGDVLGGDVGLVGGVGLGGDVGLGGGVGLGGDVGLVGGGERAGYLSGGGRLAIIIFVLFLASKESSVFFALIIGLNIKGSILNILFSYFNIALFFRHRE